MLATLDAVHGAVGAGGAAVSEVVWALVAEGDHLVVEGSGRWLPCDQHLVRMAAGTGGEGFGVAGCCS